MAATDLVADDALRSGYALRLGDTALIAGHRLSEWCGRAPTLEEELALANMGLDWLGQARLLLDHAARCEGRGRDADELAFLRDAGEFRNLLLAEQPNGDFACTMARQLFLSAHVTALLEALADSVDATLAAIARRASKECTYHLRHASEWVIRLGDGTDESHARMQAAVDGLWMYTGEAFVSDDLDRAAAAAGLAPRSEELESAWNAKVNAVLAQSTLRRPAQCWMATGGKAGRHTEHLGHLLAQMQFLPRAYPGARW